MRALVIVLLLAVAGCGTDSPSASADTAPVPPAPPPTAPLDLAEWLPASLDGQERQSLDQSVDAALGAEVTRVAAQYGDSGAPTLSVTDFGTAEMAEMMGHGWALAPGADRLDGRPVQRDQAAGVVRVVSGGRYLVEATAPSVAQAEQAIQSVRFPD